MTPKSPVLRAAALILGVSALCGLVLAAVYLDLRLGEISDGSETSVTEFAQSVITAAIAAAFFAAAAKRPDLRGGLVLGAGFFLCLAIRENDAWLDHVRHGFWFPVALCAAAVCLAVAWRNRATLRAGLDALCDPRTAALLAVGLALLLVFSRYFGNKGLWKAAGIYQTSRAIKTVAEESLELLADSFLLLWSLLTLRSLPPPPAPPRGA